MNGEGPAANCPTVGGRPAAEQPENVLTPAQRFPRQLRPAAGDHGFVAYLVLDAVPQDRLTGRLTKRPVDETPAGTWQAMS